MRFEVFTAARMLSFFWVLEPRSLVSICQRIGEIYCLHLQGWSGEAGKCRDLYSVRGWESWVIWEVIWDYCDYLFLKQFSSSVFKSRIFLTANTFCHVFLSDFVFLVEILDPTCRCLEGELFVLDISRWETNLHSFRSRMCIKEEIK
jgi:hypothetical protein